MTMIDMNQTKRFLKGRENLSVTVYVPYDCANNCKFCESKRMYFGLKVSKDRVEERLKDIRNSDIEEVVFTGGEPFANLSALKELVSIVNNKDVYINTTLPNFPNIVEIIEFINDADCIKGINISRHTSSIRKDRKILNNIVDDVLIKFIKKPKKINVVMTDKISDNEVKYILDRWNDLNCKDLTVSFREDFTKLNEGQLHLTSSETIDKFIAVGEYKGKSMCNVCDTMVFQYKDSLTFNYHRGLSTTALRIGNKIEVNDIIIFPDGELAYDWDKKKTYLGELMDTFHIGLTAVDVYAVPSDVGRLNRRTVIKGSIKNNETSKVTYPPSYKSCGYSYTNRC